MSDQQLESYDLVFIDSDSLCYACAFAVQSKCELTGEIEVEENGEKFLRSKLNDMIETIVEETGAKDYKVFLTGKGNFRNDAVDGVPTLYKANRAAPKPLLLQEARDYLISNHWASVSEGMEADDVVCIEQQYCIENDITSIIAHIDKDIDQQQGWHYKWSMRGNPSSIYYVSEWNGLLNLYRQALKGDKVDNIMYYFDEEGSKTWKKCYGLGEKGADKMFSNAISEKDLYDDVLACYLMHPKFQRKDTGEQATESDLILNLNMLYMLRTDDDFYEVPV